MSGLSALDLRTIAALPGTNGQFVLPAAQEAWPSTLLQSD